MLKNFVPRYDRRMEGIRGLSYYFSLGPEQNHLHIVAQLPPTIYCWRFGDDFSRYFKIHIDYRNCPTSLLKEAIHRKMRLYSIDVTDIELFKVRRQTVVIGHSNHYPGIHSPKGMERATYGGQVEG
jgi:hypothetical protein